MTYRGFDFIVAYDANYKDSLKWRFAIYKQTIAEYRRLIVDYASTRLDAEQKAKQYIDMWKENAQEHHERQSVV